MICVEGHEFAQRDFSSNHLASAEPEHQYKSQADQRRQRRHEHAPGGDQLQVARHVLAVGRVKRSHLRVFLRIRPDDTHAGQIFLGFRGKRGQGCLNRFVQDVDELAEITTPRWPRAEPG